LIRNRGRGFMPVSREICARNHSAGRGCGRGAFRDGGGPARPPGARRPAGRAAPGRAIARIARGAVFCPWPRRRDPAADGADGTPRRGSGRVARALALGPCRGLPRRRGNRAHPREANCGRARARRAGGAAGEEQSESEAKVGAEGGARTMPREPKREEMEE
jgi:hypothetical protein